MDLLYCGSANSHNTTTNYTHRNLGLKTSPKDIGQIGNKYESGLEQVGCQQPLSDTNYFSSNMLALQEMASVQRLGLIIGLARRKGGPTALMERLFRLHDCVGWSTMRKHYSFPARVFTSTTRVGPHKADWKRQLDRLRRVDATFGALFAWPTQLEFPPSSKTLLEL